jgi:CHASE2 domain-containing sensor protein
VFRLPRRSFEAWKRTIVTAGLVTLAVFGLRLTHALHGFETRWMDLMAYVDRPEFRAPVTVVAITDADYRSPVFFRGMSPLHPEPLARLLRTVAAHRPRGIVLDVQIHPGVAETPDRVAGRLALYRTLDSLGRDGRMPLVLVREPQSEVAPAEAAGTLQREWGLLTTHPGLHWADPGIAWTGEVARALPPYREERNPGERLPTVLGAAVEAFGLPPHRSAPFWAVVEERPTEPWHIRYTGRFLDDTSSVSPVRVTASSVLSSPVVPGQVSLLTDRIVLIGGTYLEGRDFHGTPLGEMPGVYVWAEALASWIRNDALREPPANIALPLEFLIGVLAGWLLLRFGPGWGLLYSVSVVLPLTVLFSLLTFGDRVLFVNFLPAFVAVYTHYQIELHLEIGRRRRELHEAGETVKRLRQRLRSLRTRPATPPSAPPGPPHS